MKAIKILVEPFEFLNYTKLECKKELNQHGVLRITGLIHQEKEREYMNLAAKETWVSVKVISENGEISHFFDGILTGLCVEKENQISVLSIEIKTGTFLLDIAPHIRSFQSSDFRYADLIHTCLEKSSGSCILLDKKNDQTHRFFLQYDETDWEFIKRIAACAGTVIIPEDAMAGRKFYFGYRDGMILDEIESDTYYMEQDYETYRKGAIAGGLVAANVVSYILQTREIYRLGQGVYLSLIHI